MSFSDKYWFDVCNSIANNSKCLSRKIGSVIVKDGKYITSSGYNGPVSKSLHCSEVSYRKKLFALAYSEGVTLSVPFDVALKENSVCPRRVMGFDKLMSAGIKYCQAAHSERNAIDYAARLGHTTEGLSIYMNCGIPCLECAKSIVNCGISEVVVAKDEVYERSGISGKDILLAGGVKIRVMEL